MQSAEEECNVPPENTSMHKSPPEVTAPQPGVTTRSCGHKHGRSKVYANALNALPKWSQSKSSDALLKQMRRTPGQCTQAHFQANANQAYRQTRYSTAFKAATTELHENIASNKRGKRGCGSKAIALRINSEILTSPSDRKLSGSTLHDAVKRGDVGVSPPRWGREKMIPEAVTKGLAVHAAMLQVSGNGEASKAKLKAATDALKTGEKWEGLFDTEYALKAARRRHPELLNPAGAKNTDDRRMDWLTFKMINEWTDRMKSFLIGIEMLLDSPGYISKYPCLLDSSLFITLTYLYAFCFRIPRRGVLRGVAHTPGRRELVHDN